MAPGGLGAEVFDPADDQPDGDGEERPGPAHGAGERRGVERRVRPGPPASRCTRHCGPVVTEAVANDAAPRAEAALPPRSLVAAITGAAQRRA